MSMRLTCRVVLISCLVLTAAAQPASAAEEEWIEAFDKASAKMFYYHSQTRESRWEPPAGARIKHMDGSSSSNDNGS